MTKEDEELKKLEDTLKQLESETGQESILGAYESPEPEKKESVFTFFKEILGFADTWKVGNLQNNEIGEIRSSIRKLLRMARYASTEELNIVSNYFIAEARDIGATTMGRKGFFSQIVVTQIKKEQKVKEPKKEKKGFFGKKVVEEEENE